MIYWLFSNDISVLLQWYIPVMIISTAQKCSHASQINQTWSSRTNVLELLERWLAQTQRWKNHQSNQKSDEIRRDTDCYAPLHSWNFAHSSSYCFRQKKAWKQSNRKNNITNRRQWMNIFKCKGIYGYLSEPFADIFASAQLVHLKGKSAQTTSQWSKWGATSKSPEIITQNWNCWFFWVPQFGKKLEWSGKGTAVAREWPVLQYKNTRQFQRRSSQISG